MLGRLISRASLTRGPGVKVKVTVAIFRKTLSSLSSLHLLIDFNIIHTNVGYDNISSKFDFQCPGLKVKVTGYFKKIS